MIMKEIKLVVSLSRVANICSYGVQNNCPKMVVYIVFVRPNNIWDYLPLIGVVIGTVVRMYVSNWRVSTE